MSKVQLTTRDAELLDVTKETGRYWISDSGTEEPQYVMLPVVYGPSGQGGR